ncbi:Ca2+-binding RTX toxin-like protein [Nocardioides sp. BE266]|uniref:calcium-binding protein n=1 Tax=Nocardioides sp. BE266 TaxID=2817725 RepID=UPI0028557BA7|nr:hypothetical protein [Nocardioides sp. BE266]MDR7254724.1 Ca2+-binding RTX toxin-like protein [Nocardioides sp. BE266]
MSARRTATGAAAVLGLALLVPTAGAASAAGETCRGEAATIVGDRGTAVVGTEGRDVVVTNRSSSVKTLGGDDLVCITGPDGRHGVQFGVRIETGDGNDVVDGTAADSWGADVTLGDGADRFEGGDADDYVRGGAITFDGTTVGYPDDDVDVLVGGGGDDLLDGGQVGLPSSDVLLGGAGDDGIDFLGNATDAAMVDGGAGHDSLGLRLVAGANAVATAGEHRAGGVVVTRWSAIESLYLGDPATGTADVVVSGTDGADSLSTSGRGQVVADLGGGDDSFAAPALLPEGSRLDGGPGRDDFSFGTEHEGVTWDLRVGLVRIDDGRTIPAAGFEDTFVSAPRVRLTGTDGPNALGINSCDGRVDGRDGRDSLSVHSDALFEVFDTCIGAVTLLGGRGHDTLGSRAGTKDRMVGGRGNDRFSSVGGDDTVFGGPGHDRAELGRGDDTFYGGPGRDRVDGEQGRDLCRAERRRSCER